MKELTELIKQEIQDYKEGKINRFTTNKEYCKRFNICRDTLLKFLKKGLAEEEILFRRKRILSEQGKKNWENKSEKDKERIRALGHNNMSKGFLAEEIQRLKLEKEGWKVERLFERQEVEKGEWRSYPKVDGITNFLIGTKKESISKKLILALLNLISKRHQLPDFICKKEGYVKFCEVKSQKELDKDNINQMESIKQIWNKFKIETDLVNIPVDLDYMTRLVKEKGNNELTIEIEGNGGDCL